ncbi:MAG: RloB domain-containing protein [Lachnospiraceae bacterium]|nr:RloB domain-containing protein [Lachnospiraceae bacterium]MBR4058734.1 RloB domain-containing protein [Lachnospiraceae bacterium]
MRESRTFAERTKVLKSDEATKKYFLIYEGSETEVIYFDAICSLREDIGINPLIELIPIIRSFSEDGWSNPKKILDRVIQNIRESKEQSITYESLLNRIMDYLYETKIITTSKVLARNIWKTMQKTCVEKLQKSLDDVVENVDDTCNMLINVLKEGYEVVNIVGDISDIIKDGGLTYDQDLDQICMIVDRDKESFVSSQYDYVLNKCKEMGFQFCVTNPCFEFWLLLHFDEVFGLDKEKILNNPKATSKRRYVENELHRICPTYKKSSYHAEILVKNLDKAIENEKKFCEDIKELEATIGSNIGKLIHQMRQNL